MSSTIVGQTSVNTAKTTVQTSFDPKVNGQDNQTVTTQSTAKSESDTVQISEEALALLAADNGDGVEPPKQKTDNGDGVEPPKQQAYNGDGVEPPMQKIDNGDGVEPPKAKADNGDGVEPPIIK